MKAFDKARYAEIDQEIRYIRAMSEGLKRHTRYKTIPEYRHMNYGIYGLYSWVLGALVIAYYVVLTWGRQSLQPDDPSKTSWFIIMAVFVFILLIICVMLLICTLKPRNGTITKANVVYILNTPEGLEYIREQRQQYEAELQRFAEQKKVRK